MPGPDFFVLPAIPVVVFLPPDVVLAYGPGPPVDLIPYFLGLMSWVGLAFLAILLSPLTALLRRLRRASSAGPKNTPMPESEPKSSDEDNHDKS
ncbi:MAG TPA: hypothetical protein VH643_30785 [Gemmataceae bacterium]